MSEATTNPLRQDERLPRVPEPAAVVIFGASGDLTETKIVPALYDLAAAGLLPMEFAIVGVSRTQFSHEEFREKLKRGLEKHRPGYSPEVWESFSKGLFYLPGDSKEPGMHAELDEFLRGLDEEHGTRCNRIFYLSTAPTLFAPIVEGLGQAGLSREDEGYSRLVIEKPFGRDLESAQELNSSIKQHFSEAQIYRIDHYLGKETVQNVLALRFANGIFEPLWNQHYVDHVQITVSESEGIGSRGSFYEQTGALRDIAQNHLMQVLCLTAMEPPAAFDADFVRGEKVKVLRSVRPIPEEEVEDFAVRGQYDEGWLWGEEVAGYRQEKGVDPQSVTETFVALKLFIDNWRWAGVPFYLRTGKRLPKKATEISVQFKSAPHTLFSSDGGPESNTLVIRVQPEEGVSLQIRAKVPGSGFRITPVNMDLLYGAAFAQEIPDAYQRLLLDVMLGDPTLFIRSDEAEGAWSILEPVMRGWSEQRDVALYPAGEWGPREAEELLEADGRQWRRP